MDVNTWVLRQTSPVHPCSREFPLQVRGELSWWRIDPAIQAVPAPSGLWTDPHGPPHGPEQREREARVETAASNASIQRGTDQWGRMRHLPLHVSLRLHRRRDGCCNQRLQPWQPGTQATRHTTNWPADQPLELDEPGQPGGFPRKPLPLLLTKPSGPRRERWQQGQGTECPCHWRASPDQTSGSSPSTSTQGWGLEPWRLHHQQVKDLLPLPNTPSRSSQLWTSCEQSYANQELSVPRPLDTWRVEAGGI